MPETDYTHHHISTPDTHYESEHPDTRDQPVAAAHKDPAQEQNAYVVTEAEAILTLSTVTVLPHDHS